MKFVNGSGKDPAAKLAAFAASAVSELDRDLRTAALLLRTNITRELSKPGLGLYYKRRKGAGFKNVTVKSQGPLRRGEKRLAFKTKRRDLTKFHRASAPYAPPARDLGTLFRSTYTEQSGPHQYTVGVATNYAAALEHGTRRIKPRPFMAPALAVFKKQLNGLFKVSGLQRAR